MKIIIDKSGKQRESINSYCRNKEQYIIFDISKDDIYLVGMKNNCGVDFEMHCIKEERMVSYFLLRDKVWVFRGVSQYKSKEYVMKKCVELMKKVYAQILNEGTLIWKKKFERGE